MKYMLTTMNLNLGFHTYGVLNGVLFGNFPHIMEMLMIADKDMGGVRSELIF